MAAHTHHHTAHSPDCTGTRTDHSAAALTDLLDLDAETFGSYRDAVTAWIEQGHGAAPHTIVDVGAGTGTDSLALARRFPTAEVVAVERSAVMLQRLETAVGEQGLADRIRPVRADLDESWPGLSGVDLVWASSSLHEVADPERVLRDIHAALDPGGVLVVVEMDALPRFLPEDLGYGRPGLEVRCHAALAELNWNAYPDWRPHLERAGFRVLERRGFTVEPSPAPPSAGRYARAYLSHVRAALDGRLAADDLDTLDRLLTEDAPDGLLNRGDLTVRGSRTAWAARRP